MSLLEYSKHNAEDKNSDIAFQKRFEGFRDEKRVLLVLNSTLSLDAEVIRENLSIAWSHAQTPPSHKEMGLVTIEQFLGCAESVVLIMNMFA